MGGAISNRRGGCGKSCGSPRIRMITDLVQIRMLGEKKREENTRFRKSMKSHSDRILRRIAQDIEEQIDCRACANCCRVATVRLSERDVERLARHLRIPAA